MNGKHSPSFKQRKDTIHSIGHDELQNVQAHASRPGLGISDKDVLLSPYGRQEFPAAARILLGLDQLPKRHTVGGSQRVQVMRLVKGRRC